MKCPHCGKEYESEVRFCSACGEKMTPDTPAEPIGEHDCTVTPPEKKPKSKKRLVFIIMAVAIMLAIVGAVTAAVILLSDNSEDPGEDSKSAATEGHIYSDTTDISNKEEPTEKPSEKPTKEPSEAPTEKPTEKPTENTSKAPDSKIDSDYFIGEWTASFDISELIGFEEDAILEIGLSFTRDSYTLSVSEESINDIIDTAIEDYKKECQESGSTLEEALGASEEELRELLREYFAEYYGSDTGSWSYKNGKLRLDDTECSVEYLSATEFDFKNEELELTFIKNTVTYL